MQLSIKLTLWALALALVFLAVAMAQARAQSLSPMRHTGTTPSDIKGFRLTVGNPYPHQMRFELVPMDPGFAQLVGDVSITPRQLTLAPGVKRTVIVAFRIDQQQRERTIGLCVVPTGLEGPIQPRVCGTYTGALLPR